MNVNPVRHFQPEEKCLHVDGPGLPSPASTIEGITKELDFSLDIKSAIKGKYVVKPQVRCPNFDFDFNKPKRGCIFPKLSNF